MGGTEVPEYGIELQLEAGFEIVLLAGTGMVLIVGPREGRDVAAPAPVVGSEMGMLARTLLAEMLGKGPPEMLGMLAPKVLVEPVPQPLGAVTVLKVWAIAGELRRLSARRAMERAMVLDFVFQVGSFEAEVMIQVLPVQPVLKRTC